MRWCVFVAVLRCVCFRGHWSMFGRCIVACLLRSCVVFVSVEIAWRFQFTLRNWLSIAFVGGSGRCCYVAMMRRHEALFFIVEVVYRVQRVSHCTDVRGATSQPLSGKVWIFTQCLTCCIVAMVRCNAAIFLWRLNKLTNSSCFCSTAFYNIHFDCLSFIDVPVF